MKEIIREEFERYYRSKPVIELCYIYNRGKTYIRNKAKEFNIKLTDEEKRNILKLTHNKETKDKYKEMEKSNTIENRYGTKYYFQTDEFKKQAKNTLQKKYGVENASQLEQHKIGIKRYFDNLNERQRKKFASNIINYNRKNWSEENIDITENKDKLKNYLINNSGKSIIEIANELSVSYSVIQRKVKEFNLQSYVKHNSSKEENELAEFLFSLLDKDKVLRNVRSIIDNNLELDFYIPSKKLAIEMNGYYWHSEETSNISKNLNNKTILCNKKDIELIHIFSSEWKNKKDIWKSVLKNKLGVTDFKIYARKCFVRKINDFSLVKEFLNNNHLQGEAVSSINYGLYFNNELVSLMTFCKSRFDKKCEWELLRFCNKINTSVIGGASKLFKAFLNEYNPISVISYANRRWSNGNLYTKLGFKFKEITKPGYFYVKNDKVFNRMQFQKYKLKDKLDIFDKKLTEKENMNLNGYHTVYDCGNISWIYDLNVNTQDVGSIHTENEKAYKI